MIASVPAAQGRATGSGLEAKKMIRTASSFAAAVPCWTAFGVLLVACGEPPVGSEEPDSAESPPPQFTLEVRDSRNFDDDTVVAKIVRLKIVESPDRTEELASGPMAGGNFTASLPVDEAHWGTVVMQKADTETYVGQFRVVIEPGDVVLHVDEAEGGFPTASVEGGHYNQIVHESIESPS